MLELFNKFPKLKEKLHHIKIAGLPTPVDKMENLGKTLGIGSLFIKRDDITGALYGGNKVRKLEFLLGEALEMQCDSVLTYGAAGSNHAVATAVYSKELGMRPIMMYKHQLNTGYTRKNLLMHLYAGTILEPLQDITKMEEETALLLKKLKKNGFRPYIVPIGGTNKLGTIGFVNAAFELKKQIESGEAPEPDYLYAGLGSMGTAAGLILGAKAAGMKTKIIPVAVVDRRWVNASTVAALLNETSHYINSLDGSFPAFQFSEDELHIEHSFFGRVYSQFTPEGMEAVRIIRDNENIHLDGTYTGKALSALIAHSQGGGLAGKTALFWNTLNSRSLSKFTENKSYQSLPKSLHKYFEGPLQELDK